MSAAAKYALSLLLICAVGACHGRQTNVTTITGSPRFFGLTDIKDASLQADLRHYYVAESRQAWTDTYQYRSAKFRHVVPFATYARDMSTGSLGWALSKISVEPSACAKGDCALSMLFCERFDRSVAASNSLGLRTGVECSHEPHTLWRQESGRWVALDVGTRQHLQLNANIADN
jgi:hypothetical protein